MDRRLVRGDSARDRHADVTSTGRGRGADANAGAGAGAMQAQTRAQTPSRGASRSSSLGSDRGRVSRSGSLGGLERSGSGGRKTVAWAPVVQTTIQEAGEMRRARAASSATGEGAGKSQSGSGTKAGSGSMILSKDIFFTEEFRSSLEKRR